MNKLILSDCGSDWENLKLAKGKVFGDCRWVSAKDRIEIELEDLPATRMTYERQSEMVAMCLHCEKTGDWSAFEPLAREVLLEQLNLQQPDLKQNEPQKIVTVRGAESGEVSSDVQP